VTPGRLGAGFASSSPFHIDILERWSVMARKRHRPTATRQSLFEPQSTRYWECGKTMWIAYAAHRTVTTLDGVSHLILKVRRCHKAFPITQKKRRSVAIS